MVCNWSRKPAGRNSPRFDPVTFRHQFQERQRPPGFWRSFRFGLDQRSKISRAGKLDQIPEPDCNPGPSQGEVQVFTCPPCLSGEIEDALVSETSALAASRCKSGE